MINAENECSLIFFVEYGDKFILHFIFFVTMYKLSLLIIKSINVLPENKILLTQNLNGHLNWMVVY